MLVFSPPDASHDRHTKQGLFLRRLSTLVFFLRCAEKPEQEGVRVRSEERGTRVQKLQP